MNEGNACMDCHDLKVGYGEPFTSYLGSSKRNLSSYKAAWAVAGNNDNGKPVPNEFGCLYCHNSPVLKDDPDTTLVVETEYRMRDASDHFRGKASTHPVGYDLTNGTDQSAHLLSTFDCKTTAGVYYGNGNIMDPNWCAVDGTYFTVGEEDALGDRNKELDCTDCHDMKQGVGYNGYPTHGKPPATNPFLLRAGVGGHNLATGEYDDVCRRCHGSATGSGATGIAAFKSTGLNLRLTVHQDASDTTTNVLKEYDGTLLKVADPDNNGVANTGLRNQCSTCHASHYSSTGHKLFVAGIDVSDGSQCTDCHFPGDFNNLGQGGNFVKYGHGNAVIGFGCSSCHSVNADHDPSYPANGAKMFGFIPDTTPSKYGKDLTSICKTCHPAAQYAAHTGGANDVGCIDCHDEHAEGVGSTSNRFMIPQLLPNIYPRTIGVDVERSFFQSNGVAGSVELGVYDYFVDNANARKIADMPGVNSASACDNSICHTGLNVSGTPLSPLSTFMTSSKHTGANRAAGSWCTQCHKHTDGGGSWAANNSCTTCHGQPPVSTATSASAYIFYASNTDESKTPHKRHADYGFGCKECHNQWTTNALTHDTGPETFESIWFDTVRNPAAPLYPSALGYTVATSTCNNLYCHSDGQLHTTASQATAVWMTGQQTPDWSAQDLPCNACHGVSHGTVGSIDYGAPDHANPGPTANSHAAHPYACAVCHNSTTQDTNELDGWTIDIAGNKHVNGSIDLLNGGGYTFTPGAPGSHACNTISCHGGNNATWGGAALSCDQCHFRTNAAGGDLNNYALSDGVASLINSNEWTYSGHARTTAYPSGNVASGFVSTLATDLKGCLYCHDGTVPHATATNPFRLKNKNFLAQGLTADNAYGWNDNCLICHSSLPAAASGYDPDGASSNYQVENGVKNVDQNHYTTAHTGSNKGGTFCWDCHDPHGDSIAVSPQYMFHGTNGGNPGAGVSQTSDGTYGIPTASRAVTGFDSTTGGGTPSNFNSSDFTNGAFTGLCQTCHTTALYFNQSTNTALASHNGADTKRCTDAACHPHTGDFAASCSGCHGNPPLPRPTSGTTQTWVSDNAAGTQGDHTAHATTYGITNCNGTCHISATHTTNKTTANMGVRAATAATSTGVHQYSIVDNVDVWTGNTAGITSVVDDSCVNVNCHNSTYSTNTWKSAANPAYVRYWNNTYDCYSCHAYDGLADSAIRPGVQTSVTTDWIASGSHDQHTNRNVYAVACTNCHPSGSYTLTHKSGSVNFATNFGATRAGAIAVGGVYDSNGATGGWAAVTPFTPTNPPHAYYCGNVYCHSSGEPRGAETIAYPTTTQWTVAVSGNCGTCHTITGSVLATNVHEKHTGPVASTQYNYTCQTCHNSVVDAVPNIIAGGYALHVNGTNNVAFLATETSAAYNTAGGTCTATYCHSAGLDWSPAYSVEAVNTPLTVADWDITQGTLLCNGCHGNPPSYANPTTITPGGAARSKANSHVKHNAYGCQICHYGTTTTGNTIVATSGVAMHANKAWNLLASAGQFTITTLGNMTGDVYTPTVCGAITCHGGNPATWGATLACDACHFRTTANGGDQNNFPIADGTASLINAEEWTSAGHGRTTVYPSGNVAAGFVSTLPSDLKGCMYCHDSAVNHGTATNPLRLRNKNALSADVTPGNAFGWNDNCLVCHSTLDVDGFDPDGAAANYQVENGVKNVNENHYGTLHTGATMGGTFCWDCHDPHGDNQQYMFQGTNGGSPGNGVTQTSDGTYGVPTVSRPVTGFDATAGGGTPANFNSSDFVNAAFSGLCQTCHTATLYFNQTTNTPLASHNGADTQRCTSCHAHTDDFAASAGCNGCHGYPPTLGVQNKHKLSVIVDHDLTRNDEGVYLMAKHKDCWYCHGDMDDGASNHSFMTTATLDGAQVAALANHANNSITMNGDNATVGNKSASYDKATGGCKTAACHQDDSTHRLTFGNPVELLELGAGLCSTCHWDGGTSGAPLIPSTGVAGIHVNSSLSSAPTVEMCPQCHTGHANGSPNAVNAVEIKTRQAPGFTLAVPTMTGTYGRQYSTHSFAINLGGTATSAYGKSTEAEICWACHFTYTGALGTTLSEFGVNTSPNTGNMAYNYGSLTTWNGTSYGGWVTNTGVPATWNTAVRSNPNFSYKDGTIKSMHGANYTAAGPGTDPVDQIRCSYCHDVHDTGGGTTGTPYLRGTWMGNPYKEDGAPQSGQIFANTGPVYSWGAVPRGSTLGSAPTGTLGGFWIDQNSNTPQSGWAYTNTAVGLGASLCAACHGTDINAINQFGTMSDWVSGYNGHANSVRGATAVATGETSARNIFNSRGGTTALTGNPYIHYQGMAAPSSNGSGGFRSTTGTLSYSPNAGTCPRLFNTNEWGMEPFGTATTSYNANYHKFPCSKCHNPHASRLPRLMITNCLDTKHNTWDDTYQVNTSAANVSGPLNTSRSISNWTAAVNCHRRGSGGAETSDTRDVMGTGSGWNRVTPW